MVYTVLCSTLLRIWFGVWKQTWSQYTLLHLSQLVIKYFVIRDAGMHNWKWNQWSISIYNGSQDLHICNLDDTSRGCTDWLELPHDTACPLKTLCMDLLSIYKYKVCTKGGTSYYTGRRQNSVLRSSFSLLALHESTFLFFHSPLWLANGIPCLEFSGHLMFCQLGELGTEKLSYIDFLHAFTLFVMEIFMHWNWKKIALEDLFCDWYMSTRGDTLSY